jgi:hypothetical protein
MWAITKFLGNSRALDAVKEHRLDVSKANGATQLFVMEDARLRLGESRKRGGPISFRGIF